MKIYEIVIIGGGPAGLAAAAAAREEGCESILILEREKMLGGILNQCIHNGFGLHTFKEELTGPEYADRYIQKVKKLKIEYKLNTMVIDVNSDKILTVMNKSEGLFMIQAKAVIFAMGCRERPRGALNIPGYRPAGIFSAGSAQHLLNMQGILPGREAVILGSGDIGLIMARRMTLEGGKVKAVAELMPYSGGLKRNIVQCLEDYNIPLRLSHTIIDIDGRKRIKGVTLAQVDDTLNPIPGTEEYISCDTLLLSVGLIPENELSAAMGVSLDPVTSGPAVNDLLETNLEGVFACGNVLHVHDLVDYVSKEAANAGRNAARFTGDSDIFNNRKEGYIPVKPKNGIRYTVPQFIDPYHMEDSVTILFRVGNIYTDKNIVLYCGGRKIRCIRKRIMSPGEMEQIKVKKTDLTDTLDPGEITISIEAN